MGKETIELLKNYDADKMAFPAALQQKFDGVPTRIYRAGYSDYRPLTRQAETIRSIPHIVAHATQGLLDIKGSLVGELDIPGLPFKTINGHVNAHKQNPALILRVFDFDVLGKPEASYEDRRRAFAERLGDHVDCSRRPPATLASSSYRRLS